MDTTNFIKTKNHLNHFLIYLHFLVHSDVHFFATNIVATLALARDQGKGVARLRAYK
jgi:hypothetical protein